MSMTYSEKLKDPRWQKKRLEILSRDQFRCQLCFENEAPLHVHHKNYQPRAAPWDYPGENLITLCEGCHELIRNAQQRINRVICRESSAIALVALCRILEFEEGFSTEMLTILSYLSDSPALIVPLYHLLRSTPTREGGIAAQCHELREINEQIAILSK